MNARTYFTMGVRSSAARKNIARYVLSHGYTHSLKLSPKALIDGMDIPYVDKKFIPSI